MRRIYALLGLASAQDIRDLKASTASAHERATALMEVAAAASVNWQQLQAKVGRRSKQHEVDALQSKVDDLVAAQRKSMADLVAEVREGAIDVSDLAEDVVAEARDNFDISDYVDVYDLARDIKEEIDVRDLAEDVKDNVDLDDLADKVRDNLDLDNLVDIETLTNQVTNAIRADESNNLAFAGRSISQMVNQAIEREAPGIIGAHLKHLDWNDELSIDVDVVKTTADVDVTVRSNR